MRLLVVEDDQMLADALAEGLRNEGYAVDQAFDGREALHMLSSTSYDCALLDVMLPDVDGFSVLRALRERGKPVPVVLLTARDGVEDRVRGLDLGADDYVVKPFAWEELSARVRGVIRRAYGRDRGEIRIGDLEIDPVGRVVRRAGRVIALRAKEYSLLHYLAMREGQIVNRAEIWEHLYDQNDESMSNVVDVYIAYLRSKIDREFEHKLIHTRRGQGYVLSAERPEGLP
jgi:two-component system copper resistance phosphate regulon response regulator CusR